MGKKKKLLIIGLCLNFILVSSLIITLIPQPTFPKVNLFWIKSPEVIFETLDFTLNNLWSTDKGVFIHHQNADDSYSEEGKRIYPSFNEWGYWAMLEVSKLKDNYYDNYAIPSLEFILTHLVNKSNYGVYHWCYNNGSLPSTDDIDLYNDSTLVCRENAIVD